MKYIKGHSRISKFTEPQWIEEDRGYVTRCHIWQRWINPITGYGKGWNGGQMSAHVAIWERLHGPVPDGLVLDHLCRVHECVNPDHLEPVTISENVRRGRLAKLTADNVRAIRAQAHRPRKELAAEYGVSRHCITDIMLRRRWRDI